jgi:hypothetical protein
MNIFYGIAFLVIIYYIFQWKNNSILLSNKLNTQHDKINNKIQEHLREQITKDTSLLEGFITSDSKLNNSKLFNKITIDDKRNNCNSMFLPATYNDIYKNEIRDKLFNYASMKNEINL